MNDLLSRIISSYFWNNFLRFFTEGYLEIFFGAVLNVATFSTAGYGEILSSSVSVIVTILCVFFPLGCFVLLYENRKAIQEDNTNLLKKYGTMYSEFKTDRAWYTYHYYSVFLVRRMLFVLGLVFLVDYPEVQCNAFIVLSALVSRV